MGDSKTVQTWFKQEIYLWRLGGCMLCGVTIQIFVSLVLSILLHADLLHPLEWLRDGLSQILSLATFNFEIILNFLILSLTLMYSLHYTVVPTVFVTRMEIVWKVMSPTSLVLLSVYSIIGSFFVRIFLAMGDGVYGSLTHICANDSMKQCLNECHLILVLYGTFIGFLYGVSSIFGNQNCMIFPIIQQSAFFRIKVGLPLQLRTSFMFILRTIKWFIFFYALFGPSLQYWITDLLHLSLSSLSVKSHLWNLLSLKLWMTAIVTGTVTHFLLCTVAFLFKVFQTQRVAFPIDGPFEENRCHTLSKAISSIDLPLLQYLSYLDLTLAVQHSKDRRQELFSISQPGGHPHNWNAIIKECLAQIKVVTSSSAAVYEPPVVHKQISNSDSSVYKAVHQTRSLLNPEYERWRAETFYSGSQVSPKMDVTHFDGNDSHLQSPLQPFFAIVKSYCGNKINLLWTGFLSMNVIAYFIKDIPESRIRRVFSRGQLCIWAMEALSFLAASSFHEDKYGVCQKDLGTILGTILDLQQAVNKLQKLEVPTSKLTSSDFAIEYDVALKRLLKYTIKTAIYRITIVFKAHLSSIDLSPDHRRLLNRYLEFQE